MKSRLWIRISYTVALVVVLISCGRSESFASKAPSAPAAGAWTFDTADAAGLPEDLPERFPLPDDIEIVTSQSAELAGKKSVMLTYKTRESMEKIIYMYKTYFAKQNLGEVDRAMDEYGLYIEGTTKDEREAWSIIGGRSVTDDDVIEVVFSWTEL